MEREWCDLSIREEVAIVTGSTRGIGRATAMLLAREGAAVVVTGRTTELGEEVVDLICGAGGAAVFVRADIAQETEIAAVVERAVSEFGHLSVLVNNAAPTELVMSVDGDVVRTASADWRSIVELPLSAAFYACKASIPRMIENGHGSIVNISSAATVLANPGQVAYTSGKAGLEALTRAVAVQYGRRAIRANTVIVGGVPHDEAFFDADSLEQLKKMHLTRLGTPDDIAYAVAYLASSESEFVTGSAVTVDGGLTCQMPVPPALAEQLSMGPGTKEDRV
jgi:NAD(P)-dependent dehydrogenase (short-subunit alcohol dehydrogenase family)